MDVKEISPMPQLGVVSLTAREWSLGCRSFSRHADKRHRRGSGAQAAEGSKPKATWIGKASPAADAQTPL
jgi:hypothetical protein